MAVYIEVKKLAPTDTKGTRIVARIKGWSRIVLPYNYAVSLAENYRTTAEALTQKNTQCRRLRDGYGRSH